MKKFYYFLVLFISFIAVNAQIVHIPDALLKAKLIEASPSNTIAKDLIGNNITIDINGDNEIQFNEALLVYSLNLFGVGYIEDLTGIEKFTNLINLNFTANSVSEFYLGDLVNLKRLECNNNDLSTIDISMMSNLEHFEAGSNELVSIDLPNSDNLKYLDLKINWLEELDLTNIENLEYLDVRTNGFNDIDVSNLPYLKHLEVSLNLLNSIDLSNLENLEYLSCYGNEIAELDLSNLPNLESLYFNDNNLNNIDLSTLPNLRSISCSNNNLDSLDLSNLSQLQFLYCGNTNISELDLSNNTKLKLFFGDGNNFTSLDFSNNPLLNQVDFSDNPLTYINIKNGSNLVSLYTIYPDLYTIYSESSESPYLCLDESDLVDFPGGSGNVPEWLFYNTYCSYEPGGINNLITGTLRFDSNNNGTCDDANDFINSHIKVKIADGTEEGYAFTTDEGIYNFYVSDGNFTISPEIAENPELFNINPNPAVLNFPLLDGSTQTQNFCITPNGNHPDVEIIISPLEPARPGFEATYKVVYRNKGNQTVSGNIHFEFNDDLLDFNSSNPTPANQSMGVLNYNFTELHPFETREINLSFEINTPTETPPVNIDDVLTFTAQINLTDENPDDNTFELNQIVVGSYDPNDILCLEGTSVAPEMIGEELHYRIRFENTGNFPAERVVVAMGINPDEYDISSFQLLNTSHQVQARIVNNVAEFFFEEINLGPNEEGDILLSMKSLETLSVGDAVMSYADIYFDYNYPITTNEAETIFEILGLNEINSNAEITIYPNPVKDNFNIKSDSKINQIELYDAASRLLKVSLVNNLESIQNISNFSAGTYFVKIYTEKGISVQKIIKQ